MVGNLMDKIRWVKAKDAGLDDIRIKIFNKI